MLSNEIGSVWEAGVKPEWTLPASENYVNDLAAALCVVDGIAPSAPAVATWQTLAAIIGVGWTPGADPILMAP